MVEEITKHLFPNEAAGQLLALLMAAYGFWYPLWEPLRIFYIFLLSFSALGGTAVSRLGILPRGVGHGKYALSAMALGLIGFDAGMFILTTNLERIPSCVLIGDLISWGLLVYGILGEVKTEVVAPVISEIGLRRSRFVVAAFILASVMFLPIEFLAIDSLMTVTAILSTLVGWYSLARRSVQLADLSEEDLDIGQRIKRFRRSEASSHLPEK